jgi:hypothetical protein
LIKTNLRFSAEESLVQIKPPQPKNLFYQQVPRTRNHPICTFIVEDMARVGLPSEEPDSQFCFGLRVHQAVL